MLHGNAFSIHLLGLLLCTCLALPAFAAPHKARHTPPDGDRSGISASKSEKNKASRDKAENDARYESLLPSPHAPTRKFSGGGNICPTLLNVGQDLALFAQDHTGIRYRSGGSSPRTGFDCSGFVYWVFSRQGVRVPRGTLEQAETGREVSRSAMLPGDIIVFRGVDAPSGMHSAIYIGNGKFIHSPNARSRVRVDKLSESYWASHPYTVRRVLKAPPCNMDLFASPAIANTHAIAGDMENQEPGGIE